MSNDSQKPSTISPEPSAVLSLPNPKPYTLNPKPCFYLLLALLALFAVGKVILADTLDPDIFWHLRVAEQIADQGWPQPIVDKLSFASTQQPWTPYSWLAELAMKNLWDAGGYRAAIAAQAVMEGLFIVFLGLAALEATRAANRQPRYLLAIVATAFGAFLSLAYLSFRPVTAVLVILAAIAWILLRDRRMRQESYAVWLIPPLTVLATNMHFFAILAPLWLLALLVGDLLDNKIYRIDLRVIRGFTLLFFTTIACAMTPVLGGTLRTIANYSLHDVMVHSAIISEMQPFYRGTIGAILAVLIIALIVTAVLRSQKTNLATGQILWLLGSAILLLVAGRMSPVFAIIAVPTLAVVGPKLSDRLLTRPPVIALVAVILLGVVIRLAITFPTSDHSMSAWLNRNGPDAPHYPIGAADYVDQNVHAANHRLICDFTWGGYLEWRFPNRYQTLMDGRTQLFTTDFWNNMYFRPEFDRQQAFESAHADAAILPPHSPFAGTLNKMGWQTAYADEYAQVLTPPN